MIDNLPPEMKLTKKEKKEFYDSFKYLRPFKNGLIVGIVLFLIILIIVTIIKYYGG